MCFLLEHSGQCEAQRGEQSVQGHTSPTLQLLKAAHLKYVIHEAGIGEFTVWMGLAGFRSLATLLGQTFSLQLGRLFSPSTPPVLPPSALSSHSFLQHSPNSIQWDVASIPGLATEKPPPSLILIEQ